MNSNFESQFDSKVFKNFIRSGNLKEPPFSVLTVDFIENGRDEFTVFLKSLKHTPKS